MDRIGADFNKAHGSLGSKIKGEPLPLVVPLGAESDFNGVIDLLEGDVVSWEESTLGADVVRAPVNEDQEILLEEGREQLLEALCDYNDEIADDFLEGKWPDLKLIKQTIRKHTIKGDIAPTFCGTALKNKGIQMLIDAVVDYLPSPGDVPPVEGTHPETEAVEKRKPDVKEPFSALAFKVQQEQGRKLVYIRVYSGTFKGGRLQNASRDRIEKPAAIINVHADKKERVEEAKAGDILALTGLKWTTTGDTLCDLDSPLLLETIDFAEPVISMAVEPKMTQDEDKMLEVFERLQEEDPTFHVSVSDETGQTIISGMGELHLEVLINRVETEFKLGVTSGNPQVVYKESISKKSTESAEFDRVLGDKRHAAKATVTVSPAERGTGCAVTLAPEIAERWPQFAELVSTAAKEGLHGGPMGYQVEDVNIRVDLLDGEEGSISEMAVKVAVSQAMREAQAKAGPLKLEPVMELKITVPDENMGDAIGDMNARRGEVQGVESAHGVCEVTAVTSLRSLFGYSTDIRSLTQGRGTFTMKFHRYDKAQG
jgi:elongation factor G